MPGQVPEAMSRSGVPPDRLPWLRQRLLRTGRAGLAGMCRAMWREPDRTGELATRSVPVLVIFGENDDVWSPEIQQEMARRLDARSVVIENAGHTPNEDQPKATVYALLKFWGAIGDRP